MKRLSNRKARVIIDKLFSGWMLGLCVFGVLINLILSKAIIYFGLPLYIDNVGNILAGALGGPLSGMADCRNIFNENLLRIRNHCFSNVSLCLCPGFSGAKNLCFADFY